MSTRRTETIVIELRVPASSVHERSSFSMERKRSKNIFLEADILQSDEILSSTTTGHETSMQETEATVMTE
jgi:hypothetical protein